MIILPAKENVNEAVEMRSVFCDTMIELADKDEKVMLMDADLMAAMGTKPFAAKYPQRTINCGIMEATMASVAGGLSVEGFIPYIHTFAPFCTRRALDQIWLSIAYAKLNVKIIGSDPGIMAALNGGTHMSFDDLGIMRLIPNATVIEPTDSTVLADLIRQSKDIYGVFYFRLLRRNAVKVYETGSAFEIGKSVKLRDGKDISIMTAGVCVSEALKAHDLLKAKGISASVTDMIFYKPYDREAVIREAKITGHILTCENHNVLNGIGSATAEVIAEEAPAKLLRMGIKEEFGQVGQPPYLKEHFKLRAEDIVENALKLLKK